MIIVHERPPNWDKIIEVFPQVETMTHGVYFSWHDRIYNPFGTKIPKVLVAHEEAHAERHKGDSLTWWEWYLNNKDFRLEEEIAAHRVEYQWYAKRHHDFAKRRNYLAMISKRLSGPLYGNLCTLAEAANEIVGVAEKSRVEARV